MSDEQFSRFVEQCRTELVTKQDCFVRNFASDSVWDFNLDSGTLEIGEEQYRVTAIGSHHAMRQTWLWAWANEGFSETARNSSSAIQQLFKITGFEVFRDEGVPASVADVEDLSACAIHVLDASGLFRIPGEAVLYLAVF